MHHTQGPRQFRCHRCQRAGYFAEDYLQLVIWQLKPAVAVDSISRHSAHWLSNRKKQVQREAFARPQFVALLRGDRVSPVRWRSRGERWRCWCAGIIEPAYRSCPEDRNTPLVFSVSPSLYVLAHCVQTEESLHNGSIWLPSNSHIMGVRHSRWP